jgi:hypothetical protein
VLVRVPALAGARPARGFVAAGLGAATPAFASAVAAAVCGASSPPAFAWRMESSSRRSVRLLSAMVEDLLDQR